LLLIKNQDKETYAAIHFLEAFIDELHKHDRAIEILQNALNLAPNDFDNFPLLMRTTCAIRLWMSDKNFLRTITAKEQKYFNLAVRSFGCPTPINYLHKPLKVEIDLSVEIIAKASQEIEASGRKATTKRISKHLTCSHAKLEQFLMATS
jgi:hypothetical protein